MNDFTVHTTTSKTAQANDADYKRDFNSRTQGLNSTNRAGIPLRESNDEQ
jgi:hypothetical protein